MNAMLKNNLHDKKPQGDENIKIPVEEIKYSAPAAQIESKRLDKMEALKSVINTVKKSSVGIKAKEVSREWIHTPTEIIILTEENQLNNKISVKEFMETWAGFMKNPDTDDMKYEYLSEKCVFR
jgi:ABC-type multidrug transport system ATPase subunit